MGTLYSPKSADDAANAERGEPPALSTAVSNHARKKIWVAVGGHRVGVYAGRLSWGGSEQHRAGCVGRSPPPHSEARRGSVRAASTIWERRRLRQPLPLRELSEHGDRHRKHEGKRHTSERASRIEERIEPRGFASSSSSAVRWCASDVLLHEDEGCKREGTRCQYVRRGRRRRRAQRLPGDAV